MKRYLLILLVPLAAWGATITGGTIPHGGSVNKFVVAGGDCGSTVCLAVMDFEGTGCADGDSGGEGSRTCTDGGGPSTDCSTGNCPLEQSLSAQFDITTDMVYDDSVSAVTTGFVTLDWVQQYQSGLTADHDFVLGMISSNAPNYECRVSQAVTTKVQAVANSGALGGEITIASGTTYWYRLVYDIANDDCDLLIFSDDWGGTQVGVTSSANGTAAGSVVGYAYKFIWTGTVDVTVDDIGLCTGDLGVTSVHCTD